jgi:hypothetical protein
LGIVSGSIPDGMTESNRLQKIVPLSQKPKRANTFEDACTWLASLVSLFLFFCERITFFLKTGLTVPSAFERFALVNGVAFRSLFTTFKFHNEVNPMKRSMFVLLSLIAIAALSACAPQGTPTPSVAELQATAMANAQTQIALTAASIPTATPLPPTAMPTPIPVQPTAIIEQTVVAPPTQPTVLAPAAVAPGASVDDSAAVEDNECGGSLSELDGPQVDVTFNNTTDGDLSLYLYSYKTEFGCGIGNVSVAPLESETISVPKGCYDFYGWITGPKDSTPAGYGCLTFDQTVKVKNDTLVFPNQKE